MEANSQYWAKGLPYSDFLHRYANDSDRQRWRAVYDRVALTADQKALLTKFKRQMKVLCLAGAWCGDCADQCPIFYRFAEACPRIELRFLDRDDNAELQDALMINGGRRVPVVVFLSEDDFEVARYGDRTLSRYRALVADLVDGVQVEGEVLPLVVQEWLNEFERVQWMLRLSPRLRKIHGD